MSERRQAPGSFEARRQQGRATAHTLQDAAEAKGDPLAWFDDLYKAAGDDPAAIPWAKLEPHPGLMEWVARSGHLHEGRAIDVGCGLGDNAEFLDEAGYDVTAFDLSRTAVEWARRRHQKSHVTYAQADLFALPGDWLGAFDLVHETYTLQALGADIRRAAMGHIASLAAPGGTVLAICRARGDDEAVDGPPWPLAQRELGAFTHAGLEQVSIERFTVTRDRAIAHFRATYRRPAG